MSFTGVEEVMDDVLAVLKAGMAAKLAALGAIYTDTLPAPDVTTGYWCEMEPPDPDSPEDFGPLTQPTVCIWPRDDTPSGQLIGLQYTVEHALYVAVVLRSTTRHESGRRLARYTRAVKELLCAPGALAVGSCDWAGTDWRQRDLTPDEVDYTLQGVLSGFTVTLYDLL